MQCYSECALYFSAIAPDRSGGTITLVEDSLHHWP